MQIKNLLSVLLLCCLACKTEKKEQQEKFDKTKWSTMDEMDYLYRDAMLNDLMNSYELHGVRKDSVLNLLGSPDRTDSGYLFYKVAQQRLGFFILHTKTLVIKLSNDTVEWRKIHE
jgi:hypothetical protein